MFVRTAGALGAMFAFSLAAHADALGWDGYYFGLNGGMGSAESDITRTITNNTYFAGSSVTELEAASARTLDEETIMGGAQFGVNWPLNDHFVVGLEMDAQGFGNDTSTTSTEIYSCCGPSTFTTTSSVEQSWFATARLRLGVSFDWFMAYATGGAAGSEVKFTQTFTDTFGGGIPLQTIEANEFRTGYSYGGGIELLIESGASIKVEYLRVDLGEIEAVGPIGTGTTTSNGRADVTDDFVRVGLNFQLN